MEPLATVLGTSPSPTQTAPACAACGGSVRPELPAPMATVVCVACGLEQLRELPSPAACESYYQEDYYTPETGARFLGVFEWPFQLFRRLRHASIQRRASRQGSILDVGCGRGDLLEVFKKQGWKVLGTQLSRTAARAAKETRGVDVVCGELPALELEAESFDVVTFFHVLEHLPEPGKYLQAAHRTLRADGLLVVEVPDCSSLGFRALKARSFTFDYPHHLLFFTPKSLRLLLARCGFEVEAVSRFSLEYSPYTTLQNMLNVLPGQPSRLYRALMRNADARALRRSPWTWMQALLGVLLAAPALLVSLSALLLPGGNTLRMYCRKRGR